MEEGLKREINTLDVATNVVNITIASGIFLLPALIAGILGHSSLYAYFLCGIVFLLEVLCYAEMSSRFSSSGGASTYIEKAFGSYPGFIANSIFWFGAGVLVAAALVNGTATMLSVTFPIFKNLWCQALLFVFLFGLSSYINIIGVKSGMKVVKAFAYIKLIPLILLVVLGFFYIKFDNLHFGAFPGFDKLGEASLILFFAFTGGETTLNISGEMKNPYRTAPLGLLYGVIGIVLFYCLIQLVSQGVLGDDLVNHKEAPLAFVAEHIMGKFGSGIIIVCAVISIISCFHSAVMVFSRVMFAGALEGYLPGMLSKIHPKYSTPYWAIIAFSVIAFLISISGGFKQLAVLATASMLLMHIGVILSTIRFRLRPDPDHPAKFSLPLGLSIPILAACTILWFLFQLKTNEMIGILIFIGLLTLIYFIRNSKLK